MNYLDADKLLERNKHRLSAHADDRADFWTPPNKGVSILAKTIAAYFRSGSCGRFVAWSGPLSGSLSV
jgi:hypothetical protein